MNNHQHADFGDGATPIWELYKTKLVTVLDFNLVFDNGDVTNNTKIASMAKKSNRPFISNTEISPVWGPWGILGIDYYTKKPISPDLIPAKIIKAGHDMGTTVIVHYPCSDYGFSIIETKSEEDLIKAVNTLI